MNKKLLFLIGGVFLGSLLIFSAVFAFQIGNVDGVWGLIDYNGDFSETIDVVGILGNDPPGGEWGSGNTTTHNDSLVRNASICQGDPDGDSTLAEWTGTSPSTIDNLGDHTINSTCLPTDDLFISEYVESEGSVDEDILEIYNGTGAAVNLSDYSILIFTNGSDSPTAVVDLSGTISDDDVFIIASGDQSGVTEDQTDNDIDFNGDDAIALVKNYQPDTDTNADDATCSNYATGPTTGNPADTTNLSISVDWFDQIPPNTDFNQIRYGSMNGTCLSFANQSGMAFDGANLQTPTPTTFDQEVPFLLGKFCHINNPIQADNALQTIHNQMTVSGLKCDDDALFEDAQPTELVFDYTVILDETTNGPSGDDCDDTYAFCPYALGTDTLCPFAGGINNGGCSDSISSPQPDPQYFRCYYEGDVYVDYTVALVGFIPLEDPGDICDDDFINENIDQATGQFISSEGTSNCGCVLGMITDNFPTAIELKSFEAFSTIEGVELVWETASEIDNLGFNIYRANSRYAQKAKVNPELIESQSPGGTAGAEYTYTDKSAIGGKEYIYWLEDIDRNTNRSDLSEPVQAISGAPAWHYFLPILSGYESIGQK